MMETHDCGYLTELSHRSCTASACDIDCIKNLNLHLEQYLDELSRVFFNKENMRIKQSWWLSTFYSFCIQGIIQRALKELKVTLSSEKAVDEYLRLAMRLFIARNGSFDPVTRHFASLAKEKQFESLVADLRAAQVAVQQFSWSANGIGSSGDYLKDLFEDIGGSLISETKIISKSEA